VGIRSSRRAKENVVSELDVVVEQAAGRLVVLHVAGDLDMSTAPMLADHMRAQLVRDGQGTVVDLTAVEFLGSAGLAVLAEAARHAAEHNLPLKVVASSYAVLRPIQVTGLDDALVICDTVGAALAPDPG
jgi:anti-sigma B factor antagonist